MTLAADTNPTITINTATVDDLKDALQKGLRDFLRRPFYGLFFGGVYTLGGLAILFALTSQGQGWLIIPVAVGFPLVAPFVAAGLYDVSRRLERGETFTLSDVLTVMWRQRGRELGWMAFVVLFVFWVWMYQVRLLIALFLVRLSFSSFDGLVNAVFFTADGWVFLAVGTLVGALLSAALFTLTVIAMPFLLDRDVDFVTAMITSVKTVFQSPVVLICWGWIIAVVAILSMAPAFLGLLITLPILGHATWHLYKRLVVIE